MHTGRADNPSVVEAVWSKLIAVSQGSVLENPVEMQVKPLWEIALI